MNVITVVVIFLSYLCGRWVQGGGARAGGAALSIAGEQAWGRNA